MFKGTLTENLKEYSMSERVEIDGLKVAKELYDFVANEAVVGTSISTRSIIWRGR